MVDMLQLIKDIRTAGNLRLHPAKEIAEYLVEQKWFELPLGVYRAECKQCGTKFAYSPLKLHSTKGENPIPRCPRCRSYRETIITS